MAYSEELVEMETHPLVVDDRGMTLIDEKNGEDIRCAMRWKSLEKFQDSLVERLTSA